MRQCADDGKLAARVAVFCSGVVARAARLCGHVGSLVVSLASRAGEDVRELSTGAGGYTDTDHQQASRRAVAAAAGTTEGRRRRPSLSPHRGGAALVGWPPPARGIRESIAPIAYLPARRIHPIVSRPPPAAIADLQIRTCMHQSPARVVLIHMPYRTV